MQPLNAVGLDAILAAANVRALGIGFRVCLLPPASRCGPAHSMFDRLAVRVTGVGRRSKLMLIRIQTGCVACHIYQLQESALKKYTQTGILLRGNPYFMNVRTT